MSNFQSPSALLRPFSSHFTCLDASVPTTPHSARQRQRARKRSAQERSREYAQSKDLDHQLEVQRLTESNTKLRDAATQMEARLQSLACSSALDAKAMLLQKEQIARLTDCNQKWDREGKRLGNENKRLRTERDRARSQNSPSYPAPSRFLSAEPSSPDSPPRTPRTPDYDNFDA